MEQAFAKPDRSTPRRKTLSNVDSDHNPVV